MDPVQQLRAGGSVGGCGGGSGPWLLSLLSPSASWVVVPTVEEADRWFRALRFHLGGRASVLLYPADDLRYWDPTSPSPELVRQRLIARAHPEALVVAPAAALLKKVPVLEQKVLRVGDELPRASLLSWLDGVGYSRMQELDGPGGVAVRGAQLDLWTAEDRAAVRIEWDDDEIVGLRSLEATDGGKSKKLNRLRILPLREARLDASSVEHAAAWLYQRRAEQEGKDHRRILTDLRDGHWWSGAELYAPALHPLHPLQLPPTLYLVEPEQIRAECARQILQIQQRYDALRPEDRPYSRPDDLYLLSPPLLAGPALRGLVMPGDADLGARPTRDWRIGGGDLEPLVQRIRAQLAEGQALTLVSDSPVRAERVRVLLAGHGLKPVQGRGKSGVLGEEVGDLPDGFAAPGITLVTASEIFGERLTDATPSSATRRFRRAATDFARLKRGDVVVHSRHGVGLYQGLARLPLGETEGDFVMLEYRNGEKLYLPVHRLDQLAPWKAVGDERPPTLDRLGGVSWELKKAKVKDNLLELAHQLLEIEAKRQVAKSVAFAPPSSLYRQFEATFPYEETPDQATSIDEVLDDLEQSRPMDRLLVGDVGFGKTEVSMRAAFRAVEEGYQVAVLCPTTILAWQHLRSFRERFSGFPLRIEGISRFGDGAEQRSTLQGLAEGKVDILIGTHKMLGRAVRFKKLGLVVVDEEHRFGVKQKQDLKKLATGVHYLAMSATPIPRTLQMALSGLRSLSVITTPPPGRKPIRTEVIRFSNQRVQEDILSELARGGQVFFVHNRVQSIGKIAAWLQKLVPEARLQVAHGQMPEDELEAAMLRFVRHEVDVLVCTTIIESGVDLPKVNTMLINRAEGFGLAQLYQLRGRVGRGDVSARCTLLVSGAALERQKATERLMALQEATTLGSGMTLASRDLEMRGSGDLLGDRQHGSIAAIGFDAYVELLEEAVAVARGQVRVQRVEPEVEVPVPALIPEDYVAELGERLESYRLLSSADSRSEVNGLVKRLEQRHGRLPNEVENLRWLSLCRVGLRELGVQRASVLKIRMILDFHPSSLMPTEALLLLCKQQPGRFRLTAEGMLAVHFTPEEGQQPLRILDWAINRLAELLPGKK